jgi:hypothetical protein
MMTTYRSRLVLALIALLAIAGGAYAGGAQRGDDPGLAAVTPVVPALPPVGLTSVPVGGELPQVSPVEAANARAALTRDEVFQSIAAQTSWTVAQEVPSMSDGGEKIGVALIIQLDEATVSEGPWRQFRCQGTMIYEYTQTVRNITLLGATFNWDGSELLALQPLAPSSAQSLQFDDDAEAPKLKCPPGAEEGNN